MMSKDLRKDKGRWLDMYYKLDPKQREEIKRIIKTLEEEMNDG